jgi:hypothetical protein
VSPILTDGPMMAPDWGIDQLHVGLGAQLGATAAEAWADSPVSQLSSAHEIGRAKGEEIALPISDPLGAALPNAVDLTEEVRPAVPRMDIIEANFRVKQAGLEKHLTLPNQPDIPHAQLEIMIRQAQARRDREATIERGPDGFIPSALQVGTSFLVGAVDPINVASAFVPIMGELRYGKLLAGAGDSLSARLAVRAGVGAAQGAAGQALLEPLDWWAHTQQGRDFGMANVLENLMFGAALGGGLHAGGGFISDAYRRRVDRPLFPYDIGEPLEYHTPWDELRDRPKPPPIPRDVLGEFPGLPEQRATELEAAVSAVEREHVGAPSPEVATINDLPPRAHEDAMRVAIADLVDGNPVRSGDVIEVAARTDPRIAESLEAPRREKLRPTPVAPDPLDLAMSGELTAARAQQIADDLKRQQREIEDAIFKGRADEWRKLQRQSDRAWDNARDAEARALDDRISKLEEEVGLTKADEDWLDGRGWDEFSVAENWDDLARSLDNVSFGRDDAIAEAAAAVRYLPKTRDWAKMSTRERQAVLVMLSALNEEKKAGRDPKEFLRDAFQERIRRYGGGADAHEVVGYQMQELADLLSGPLERSGPEGSPVLQAEPLSLPPPRGEEGAVHVSKAARRGRAAADPQTWSLFEMLASEGGIRPDQELTAIFGSTKSPFVPSFGPLIRKNGRTLDDALRLAKDHGYLFDAADVTGAEGKVAINDLLDRLAEENAGRKQYRGDNQYATKADLAADLEREKHDIIRALHDEIEGSSGQKGTHVDPALEDRVVQIIQREGEKDVLAAYERAIMEDAERYEGISRERSQHAETAHIPGWDAPEAGAASGAGAADQGQRRQTGLPDDRTGSADGAQPRAGGAGDRAPAQAQLDKAAAWRGLSHVTPEFDAPDIVAASNAAAKVQPPKTSLDERVTAAEKADAYAKSMYDMFAHRLPEDERLRLEETIQSLEQKQADRDFVTQRGAACLFEGSQP